MNILLASKYFFPNGGTEIYLRILLDTLPALGHACVPFSVAYKDNWPSPYAKYFVPPPAVPDAPRLEQMRLTPALALRLLERSTYSFTANRYLRRLLDAVGPIDVAMALNIYTYLSPSIFHVLAKRGIPIVAQVGDYNMICPNYQLLRDDTPCQLCQKGAYYHAVRYRCVKHSLAASTARVAAMYVQRFLKLWDLVDLFLVPCHFMKKTLVGAGFRPDRLHVLPYAIRVPVEEPSLPKGNYILSFGRVSREKGIDILIRAYQLAAPGVDLVIVGRSYDNEQQRLQSLIAPAFRERIRFVGFQEGEALARWIGQALLCVVPSRWYDNAPLAISESLGHGTAVAGARLGGIPEQIDEGVDGVLFDPNDPTELAGKLVALLADKPGLARMGLAGRRKTLARHDPTSHATELVDIFSEVIRAKHRRRHAASGRRA
jgi:glycosyltransferase involved in cell wall biosynthesis